MAWGQFVILFIKGYIVTTNSDDAPSRILEDGHRILQWRVSKSDLPIPIQLHEHPQTNRQLPSKKSDGPRRAEVTPG